MKPTTREKAFADKVRSLLDADLDGLDPDARKRLLHARLAELDVPAPVTVRRRGKRVAAWATMVTAAASVAIIAINLTIHPFNEAAPILPDPLVADVEVLSSGDHFDLYEDLDFYRWLAEATDVAGLGAKQHAADDTKND